MKKGEIISVVGEWKWKDTVIRAVLGALAGGGKVTQEISSSENPADQYQDEWRQLRGTRISMIFQDCGEP